LSLPLKFPPKYYLIKHNDEVEKKVEYPLSFLTPDGDDAAEKRKDTGRRWAGGHYYWRAKREEEKSLEECVIDNVPVEGFQIVNTVSRSTTDNKVFRIFDPRKFQCEISSYNLFDIIANGVVDHGVVQGKYVWARDGQQNYLIPADDKDYLASLLPQEDYTPQIGDHIESQKVDGILMGEYYVSRITTIQTYANNGRWGEYIENLVLAFDNKPWLVIDEGGDYYRYKRIRKLPKTLIVKQKQKVPNPVIDTEADSLTFFYKTKAEQEAFNPTETEIRTLYYDRYIKPNDDKPYGKHERDRFNKYGYGGKVLNPEAL
jgi:hypothetical protein